MRLKAISLVVCLLSFCPNVFAFETAIQGRADTNGFQLSWISTPPLKFAAESQESLTDGTWLAVANSNLQVSTLGDRTTLTDMRSNATSRFYRVGFDPETPLCTNVCFVRKFSLLDVAGRDLRTNVLKLFSAAVDPSSNRLFVTGILTEDEGVLNTVSQTWESTLHTGDTGWKYLWVDDPHRFLYLANGTSGKIKTIHLDTRATLAETDLSTSPGDRFAGSFARPAIDQVHGRFYLGSERPPYLRVFEGATLAPVTGFTTGLTVPPGTGHPIHDPSEDVVYVFDILGTTTNRNFYRVNPTNGSTISTHTFWAPPGQRAVQITRNFARNQFNVVTEQNSTNHTLLLVNQFGTTLRTNLLASYRQVSDMAFEAESEKLILLTLDAPTGGRIEGIGGFLEVYDAIALTNVSEVAFGRKPQSLAYDPTHHRYYVPNGDASVVWSFDPPYTNATGLRLGDSVEQVVPVDGTTAVVMNSRLGGSYLVASDVARYTNATFTSGVWPIPIRVERSGQRLFVLNAWDSRLAIYSLLKDGAIDPLTPTLVTNITLPLPPGSTDRLPDLAIDSSNHLALIGYPEFNQLVVVDTTNYTIVRTDTVPVIPADESSGGPGQMNVGFNEAARLRYVFRKGNTNLLIFPPLASPGLPKLVSLTTNNWGRTFSAVNTEFLFRDETNNRLFVGPLELDPLSGAYLGSIALTNGSRVFAYDSVTDCYWTLGLGVLSGVPGMAYFVAALDRATLALQHKEWLLVSDGLPPQPALDVARRLLYVGYVTKAELHIYSVTRDW